MGTQKLKAAVISAGMIANSGHIPAYKAFSQDVSLEAVCDLNASAARTLPCVMIFPAVL